jgi:hypothetical protein
MTTSNSIEGEAYDWYLWWSRKCDARSFHWKNFTTTLLKIFHDEEDEALYNKFMHLKHNENINDYTHEWEVLETRKCGFTNEKLIKMHICGLKDYIRNEIKLWNPKTIEDARHTSRLIEQKNKFNKPTFRSPERLNKYLDNRTRKYNIEKPNKYLPPHLREVQSYHQDSNKKWESKCRYCGDKWSPGHKCNNKKLYSCKVEK